MLRKLSDPRIALGLAALLAVFAAAAFVPLPSVSRIREWADSIGPAFLLVFFVAYAVITIAPIPRTLFTLSSGVLFGPIVGIGVAVAATTVSATLAFLLVRAIGRDWVAARLTHPAVRTVDARLERRGWLAVGSLRLVAIAPFSIVNYCSAVSAVRFAPYVAATVVGVLPGTITVVTLGDALSGEPNPALLIFSCVFTAIGITGVILDTRLDVKSEA